MKFLRILIIFGVVFILLLIGVIGFMTFKTRSQLQKVLNEYAKSMENYYLEEFSTLSSPRTTLSIDPFSCSGYFRFTCKSEASIYQDDNRIFGLNYLTFSVRDIRINSIKVLLDAQTYIDPDILKSIHLKTFPDTIKFSSQHKIVEKEGRHLDTDLNLQLEGKDLNFSTHMQYAIKHIDLNNGSLMSFYAQILDPNKELPDLEYKLSLLDVDLKFDGIKDFIFGIQKQEDPTLSSEGYDENIESSVGLFVGMVSVLGFRDEKNIQSLQEFSDKLISFLQSKRNQIGFGIKPKEDFWFKLSSPEQFEKNIFTLLDENFYFYSH